MSEPIIEFKNVSKKFRRGRKLLLKEALLDLFKPSSTVEFWALRDVSFSVNKGETLGIIGENGSGKSTILKLVAGVMGPNKGEVIVRGKVAPLIELGAGFHPELSGRENIYLNASILGMTKPQIDEKLLEIIEFSQLSKFIDTPIKHYSSGMYMRLGFSIAINTEPDILLMDEILTVGDEKFQKKSMEKMNELKSRGTTILFVSHALKVIEHFCERAILLKKGKLILDASSTEALEFYREKNG